MALGTVVSLRSCASNPRREVVWGLTSIVLTVIPLLRGARIAILISLKRVLRSDCPPNDFVVLLLRIIAPTKLKPPACASMQKFLDLAEGK